MTRSLAEMRPQKAPRVKAQKAQSSLVLILSRTITGRKRLHQSSLREVRQRLHELEQSKLEEQRPERAQPFTTGAIEHIKHIHVIGKNSPFFIEGNVNRDGMAALLDYSEGGVTPYGISFKDGVQMEKC